ncbi:DEAD/DEAH box helicase [Dokdonella koreensis]|uniref:DEAD-box ATP-dependent RNA helicase RhpA n=1 Tax=Dokdonella koreensis DS-123 TaxID=1300342 RepID=A0A160DUX0_9GAMM|nr:DEAD/DEAH box helicase [Dokdonella koreensis]ANB18279.1 ATP-dependent RNA helicase RhlE [Dokdonella koreensis DS-123]
MSFESLGLAPELNRALAELGYAQPTPIQSEAIPLALAGHDLMGGAQTGTGKTAAFALPLLQRIAQTPPAGGPRRPRALVLTPTRELAVQVHDSLRAYGKYLRLASTTVYGGAGMQPQIDALRRGVDILVATPGRLIDHMERRSVDLSQVQVLVLDEADRMLDMGFLAAIKRILGKLPANRQTLLFSATFEDAIKKLAMEFLRDPREVQVSTRNTVASTVAHRVHPVDAVRKRDLLVDILSKRWQEQVLVFGRTKHGCNRLAEQLEKAGIESVAIHGNKSQAQRLKALRDFKSGKARVMVATDVAARGLDIPQLPLVINFDLPMVAEDYVHRIGRTGRAGATGEAISLVAPDESELLRAIRRLLKNELEIVEAEGYAPSRALDLTGHAPAAGRPAGQRQAPKKRSRRSRGGGQGGKPQAHAGAKKHGAQRSDGSRRGSGGR